MARYRLRGGGPFVLYLSPCIGSSGSLPHLSCGVENNPKLQTACSTPIMDGMVIDTESEKVRAARKAVIELLLIRHPLDCFSCSSNGKCELQSIAYDLGIEKSPFCEEGDTCRDYELDDSNPFMYATLINVSSADAASECVTDMRSIMR